MRNLLGMVAVAGVLGLFALSAGASPELRASQPPANAAKVAPFEYGEAHFSATLATHDTQLYSVAPREHIAAPASRLKTDRLTVRQLQAGEMYVPHATYQVGEMDMPVNMVMKVDEMDRAAPKRAIEVAEMDMRVKRPMQVGEMDMSVRRTMEVAEMDMPHLMYGVGNMGGPHHAAQVGEMDPPVNILNKVDEMDMPANVVQKVDAMAGSPSHPTRASALDVSPRVAAVQRVLDRLQ